VNVYAEQVGVQEMARKIGLYALVVAPVMSEGSDYSGRQTDVFEAFRDEGTPEAVRDSDLSWLTDLLAELMRWLLDDALEAVWERPSLLTGELAELGVKG
jgi:hypothetical protein